MRRIASRNQWNHINRQHDELVIASTRTGQAAVKTSTNGQGSAFNTRQTSLTAHNAEVERILDVRVQ